MKEVYYCPECGKPLKFKLIKMSWVCEEGHGPYSDISELPDAPPGSQTSDERITEQPAPSQQNAVNAAANLAILSALLTLGVAILQFISGYTEAIIAGVINTIAAISYLVMSFSIRNRAPGAYKTGLSTAKWGLLWVLGMAAFFMNTSGGLDMVSACIFGGWLATDGLLYLTLKSAKDAFPENFQNVSHTKRPLGYQHEYKSSLPPVLREREFEPELDDVLDTTVDKDFLSVRLQTAEAFGRSGELEQAAQELEQAYKYKPRWATKIAGVLMMKKPISGYALLIDLAGRAGKKELAIQYFKRMLVLNPGQPGFAQQAALEAGISKEAHEICEEQGIRWIV